MKYRRPLIGLMIALAIGGFFVAFYLTVEHYLGRVPTCSFLSGCEVVTTSSYSTVLGIPISLLGAGYFLSVAALLALYLQRGSERFFKAAGVLVSVGAVIASVLIYLQVAVLEAICIYCITSDSISLLLLLLFISLRARRRATE